MSFKLLNTDTSRETCDMASMEQGKSYRNINNHIVMYTDEGTVVILHCQNPYDIGYLADCEFFDHDEWYPVTIKAAVAEGHI